MDGMLSMQEQQPFQSDNERKRFYMPSKSMNRDKAPSPDRFTITFFQNHWSVVIKDIISFFIDFHDQGMVEKSPKAFFVVLIPKKVEEL